MYKPAHIPVQIAGSLPPPPIDAASGISLRRLSDSPMQWCETSVWQAEVTEYEIDIPHSQTVLQKPHELQAQ